jgi:hypothetical protein
MRTLSILISYYKEKSENCNIVRSDNKLNIVVATKAGSDGLIPLLVGWLVGTAGC